MIRLVNDGAPPRGAGLCPKPRLASAFAALGVLLAPAVALACPYCATRSGGGIGQSIALGAFILLPFGVSGVVYSVLRREAE